MIESATIGFDDGAIRVATWRNVVVNAWRGEVTIPRLDKLLAIERQMRMKYPGKLFVASLIGEVPTAFLKLSDEARTKSTAIAREMDRETVGHANVVLGTGFWAATVRSLVAASFLVSRPTHPSKAFDNVNAAATWGAPLASKGSACAIQPTELRGALESVLDGWIVP